MTALCLFTSLVVILAVGAWSCMIIVVNMRDFRRAKEAR